MSSFTVSHRIGRYVNLPFEPYNFASDSSCILHREEMLLGIGLDLLVGLNWLEPVLEN